MALSARNHLKGTVKSVKLGTIMAEVVVDVGATRSCQVTQDRLDAIAAELNSRPRQTLGFQTPSQVLAEALPDP